MRRRHFRYQALATVTAANPNVYAAPQSGVSSDADFIQ